jgi:hypothetical protein
MGRLVGFRYREIVRKANRYTTGSRDLKQAGIDPEVSTHDALEFGAVRSLAPRLTPQ